MKKNIKKYAYMILSAMLIFAVFAGVGSIVRQSNKSLVSEDVLERQVVSSASAATWNSGSYSNSTSFSRGDIVYISNATDMSRFDAIVSGGNTCDGVTFYLTNNISYSNSIGETFSGTLMSKPGYFFEIKFGIIFDDPGFFYTLSNATIRNVKFSGTVIYSKTDQTNLYIGGLASYIFDSKIDGCDLSVAAWTTKEIPLFGLVCVGGVAGIIDGNTTISNNNINVNVLKNGADNFSFMGLIAGATGTIIRAYGDRYFENNVITGGIYKNFSDYINGTLAPLIGENYGKSNYISNVDFPVFYKNYSKALILTSYNDFINNIHTSNTKYTSINTTIKSYLSCSLNDLLMERSGSTTKVKSPNTGIVKLVLKNGSSTSEKILEYTRTGDLIKVGSTSYSSPSDLANLFSNNGISFNTSRKMKITLINYFAEKTYSNYTEENFVDFADRNFIIEVEYEKPYTVSFNANGGSFSGTAPTYHTDYGSNKLYTSSSLSSEINVNGSGVIPLPVARTGYTFKGYSTSTSSSTANVIVYNGGNFSYNSYVFTSTSNITLYAVWTANTYTITYKNPDGTTLTTDTSESVGRLGEVRQMSPLFPFLPNINIIINYTKTHTYGTARKIETTGTRTGYTFGGWYKEVGLINKVTSIGATEITTNITLYAKWIPINNLITYNLAGGSVSTGPSIYSIIGSTTLPNPTRTGYTFAGWKITAASKNTNEQSNVTSNWTIGTNIGTTIPAGKYGNIIISAQWNPITYTITYKNPDETALSTSTSDSVGKLSSVTSNHTFGSSTPINTTATRTGYIFGGWYKEVGLINKVTSIGATDYSANITLYAKWTANTYAITYKNPDGTALSISSDLSVGRLASITSSHTYDTATPINTTATRTGYTFGGWYKEAGLINKVTSIGATDYSANITLYAKWTAIDYTISYNLNKGTGSTVPTMSASPETYKINTSTSLATPIRIGYDFAGWMIDSVSKNANEQANVTYNWTLESNISTTISNGKFGNITLKAIWKAKTISLNFDSASGTFDSSNGTVSVYVKFDSDKYYTDANCTQSLTYGINQEVTDLKIPVAKAGDTLAGYQYDGTLYFYYSYANGELKLDSANYPKIWKTYTGNPITLTAVYKAAPITIATSDYMLVSPNTNFFFNDSTSASNIIYLSEGSSSIYINEGRTNLLTKLTYENLGYKFLGLATESGVTSTDDARCLFTYSGTTLTMKSAWNSSVGILYPIWEAKDVALNINANSGSEIYETTIKINGATYSSGMTVKFGSNVTIEITVPYGYNINASTSLSDVTMSTNVSQEYIDTIKITYRVTTISANNLSYTISPKTISKINVVNHNSSSNGSTALSSGPASFEITNAVYGQNLPQISVSNIPTREGYTFLGYSRIQNKTDNNGSDVYYKYNVNAFVSSTTWKNIENNSLSSEGDIATLYAIWVPNQYNVTFNANGGNFTTTPPTIISTFDSKEYKEGETTFAWTSNIVPTRGGYIFLGFTTTRDDENTTIVSFDDIELDISDDYKYSHDSVFYALWAPDTNTKYIVNIYRMDIPQRNPVNGIFETNRDTTSYTKFETKVITGTTGELVNPGLTSYKGFALYTGHSSATNMSGLVISYGLVINVYYERESFTLSVEIPENKNGFASYAAGSTTLYTPYENDNFFYFGEQISITDSIKDGYVFAGYKYGGDSFVAQNNFPISVKMGSSNSTIELQTDLVSYEIRLNLGSDIATWSDSLTPISGIVYMTYNVEQGVTLPIGSEGATRLGYTLTGWELVSKTGNVVGKYKNSTNPNGTASDTSLSIGNEVISIGVGSFANLELNAVWTPNRYKVIFDATYEDPRTDNIINPFDGVEKFAYAEYDSDLLYTTNDRYNPTVFTTYPLPSRVGYKFLSYKRFENFVNATEGYKTYITANYVEGSVDSYTLSSTKFTPKTIPSSNEFTVRAVYEAMSVNYTVNIFLMNADGTFNATKTLSYNLTAISDTTASISASNFITVNGDILEGEYVAVDTDVQSLYVLPDGSAEIDLLFKRTNFNLKFVIENIYAQHSLIISDNFAGSETYRPIAGSYYWGASVTVKAVLKNGYKFGSLNVLNLGSSVLGVENISQGSTNNVYKATYSFTMPKTNLTSNQNVLKIEYTIKLKYQLSAEENSNYFIDSEKITLPVPTSTGYNFLGWKVTKISSDSEAYGTTATLNGTAKVGDIISSIDKGSYANVELEAQWSLIEYTVTYNPNGGDVYKTSDTYVYENTNLPNGTTTSLPQTLILPIENQDANSRLWRNGYKFAGWKVTAIEGSATGRIVGEDDPTEIEVGDILLEIVGLSHANISVEAQWTIIEYEYKFNLNGGTINTTDGSPNFATSYNYSIISGDQIFPTSDYSKDLYLDPADKTYKMPFERDGYFFTGWKITEIFADAGYNTYIVGLKVGISTEVFVDDIITKIKTGSFGNINLEAQWAPKLSYVTFNANGGQMNIGASGSNSTSFSEIKNVEVAYGAMNAFTEIEESKIDYIKKAGYVFAGWYLDRSNNIMVLDANHNYVEDASETYGLTIPGKNTIISEKIKFSLSGEWRVFSKYFENFPTDKITLKAHWEAIKYTVELDKNWNYIPLESGENASDIHNYDVKKTGSEENFMHSFVYEMDSKTYTLVSSEFNNQVYTYIYSSEDNETITKEYRLYPGGTFILPNNSSNEYTFSFSYFSGENNNIPTYSAYSSIASGTLYYRDGKFMFEYYDDETGNQVVKEVELSFLNFDSPIIYTKNGENISQNQITHSSLTTIELTYGMGESIDSGYTLRGHYIKGWALTPDGTPIMSDTDAKILNLITIPNGVTRLYAIWEAETYDYTFEIQTTHVTDNPRENLSVKKVNGQYEKYDLNTNSQKEVYTATRTYGDAVTFRGNYTMTRLGYKFAGFTINGDPFETLVEGISFDSIDNNTIYKAMWIIDPISVDFVSDSALLSGDDLEVKHGAFSFGEERIGSLNNIFYVNNTSAVPYFAQPHDTNYPNDIIKRIDSNEINGYEINKIGYNFLGWFIATYNGSSYTVTNTRVDNLTIDTYAQLDKAVYNDKVVLVARWTPVKSKLTIIIGYCNDDSILDGTELIAINPQVNLDFRKYQLGNMVYTTVNSLIPYVKTINMNIDGVYSLRKVYCLEAITSYDSEYVIPGYIKMSNGSYSIKNQVVLPDGSSSQIFSRNGYNFFGWFESITSTGVPVGGEIAFIGADNLQNNLVIANIKGASYNITYNPGRGAIIGSTTNSYTYGDTVILPTAEDLNAPDEGYTFDGWYLGGLPSEPDASLRVTVINSTDFGDKKLFALWLRTTISDENGDVVIQSTGFDPSYTLRVNNLTVDYKFYDETKQVRKRYNVLAFYDVVLLRNNIATIQSSRSVTVKLKIPEEIQDPTKLKAAAIGEDGSYEIIEGRIEDGYLVFASDSITYFVIVTEGEGIASTADIPTWVWGIIGGSMMLVGAISLMIYFSRRKKRRPV